MRKNQLIILVLLLCSRFTEVSCSCSVFPAATAVVAGDSLSLTCVPGSQSYVSGLTRDDGANGTVKIYQSALYNNFGQITRNKSVADGYSVDDESARPNVTLTLNKSVTAQAGYYNCQCSSSVDASSSFAGVSISVLDSEPQFSSNGSSLSINDSVQLSCSVSFHGKANSSFQIFDGDGTILASLTDVASSSVLQSPSLTYIIPANDVFRNDYSCNVVLSSDSVLATAYNKTLKTTVRFSVRHTTIVPESMSDCHENGFCKRNMKMLCSVEGSPNPAYYWTVYFNGGVLNSSELYYYTSNVGMQTIKCTAYNVIGGKIYYDSANFTTSDTNRRLIVGVVAGLGGGIILTIIIVVIAIKLKRQRKKQTTQEHPYEVPSRGTEFPSNYTDLNPETYTKLDRPAQSSAENDNYTRLNSPYNTTIQ